MLIYKQNNLIIYYIENFAIKILSFKLQTQKDSERIQKL